MIERKEYMALLEKWRDKKVIKVVTGIRRCGKSSLLRMSYVEQSFQPIYHPSRFIVEIHINLLIYRYFNSVMDTPETGISITLSLTIWLHPSRFSHHKISHAVIETLAMDGWHLRKLATEADKIAQLHR